MAKSTRGTSQDRKKVAGNQKHEVDYVKGKTGASAEEVKSSIKKVGNQRSKVVADLKKSRGK